MNVILVSLPIISIFAVIFWHAQKCKKFEAELFSIYDANGVMRPQTGCHELNGWKKFQIQATDNEIIRFAKNKLLEKVYAHSRKVIVLFFGSFFGSIMVMALLKGLA